MEVPFWIAGAPKAIAGCADRRGAIARAVTPLSGCCSGSPRPSLSPHELSQDEVSPAALSHGEHLSAHRLRGPGEVRPA